jgi:ribosomal protein L7/L12
MSSTDHSQNQRLVDAERRLTAIEYNLRRVMAVARVDWQEPPSPNDELPREVLDALAARDKMRAIQELVRLRGLSLSDAKKIVDRY